ncbi:MAG TPA: hemolysin family protein [Gemmatimonadaceae bacterium]|nr:hemolysin family protein [Gemmatimonadaceae bacterium]
MLGRILIIAVLLLLNGFFVGVEFALVRSRRTRLEAMARGGDRLARLALRAVANIGRLLSATQLGITVVSLAIGALAEETLAAAFKGWLGGIPIAARLMAGFALGSVLAIMVTSYFHVVFGELAPKSIALVHPERMARLLAPPLMAFEWITRPFNNLLTKSAQLVLRALGIRQAQIAEEAFHSPEELRMLVEQSQEGGAIEQTDASLIEGVFEFSEKNAREVMTPRTNIDALAVDATLDETLALVEETQRSRYPVFDETIDDIVGLVLAKDLLPVLRKPPTEFSIRTIMRPIHVVPGSREVEEVLADFKRLKEHLAIVLDEYGGTAGLVTMEDLLEEIVGEILDEKDEPPEPEERESPDLVLVAGSTNIADLNERFGLDVPDDDYTTIGGFVFGALGRLPIVGDRVTAGGAIFTVREMEGRRIETLAVDLHSAGDRRGKEREAAGS